MILNQQNPALCPLQRTQTAYHSEHSRKGSICQQNEIVIQHVDLHNSSKELHTVSKSMSTSLNHQDNPQHFTIF